MTLQWTEFLPLLFEGAFVTVEVAFYAALLALLMSFAAGLGRIARPRVIRGFTAVYVEFFRGSSLLIQLFWLYYALPFVGIELPKLAAAVLAVGLNYGAYGSEIVRSSVQAVPRGQWEAAIALNMSIRHRWTRIILPQAVLQMLPSMSNLLIELIKATSLVYFITLTDLTYQAMVLRNNYMAWTPQILFMLLLLYFAMASVVSYGVRRLESRMAAGRG
ncbi:MULTISPECIES: ectoine/hydroxyectoine ABC transporter permease subunit EhuC [Paenibacillus]|uniref:ectoine/hydroxyectoine ABC transporter permease subunit EhuC n=1 Tax=Paenibacillus TaxID=44249 RepID=UPI0022B8F0B0|nr:ectoine/hydroxyectoine ABC transporter permease subunit EhuC [Paenibacillus caseinilyticus]MCZ8521877.1 ectoine/hydroxyectoine ABC transporter permease subunit EhuC [Paenibacillus caseinilyticus]